MQHAVLILRDRNVNQISAFSHICIPLMQADQQQVMNSSGLRKMRPKKMNNFAFWLTLFKTDIDKLIFKTAAKYLDVRLWNHESDNFR